MNDGSPALEVAFEIDTGGAFEGLAQLEGGVDRATASIIAEAAKVERATSGMVQLGGATAQVTSFGNASTRALRDAAREYERVERAGEGMVRQLNRQAEVFGKSAVEIRRMRVEARAVAAESQGLTELAMRLREAGAEMDRLEANMGRGVASAGAHRQAMAGATFQVQDFFTQVSMGANPLNAFAVQGAQLAGQFAAIEGTAGNVARFFMGPWGLAITAGTLVFSMFADELFSGGEEAENTAEKIKDLSQEFDFAKMSAEELIAVNKLLADANADIQRTAIGAANATRIKAEADRDAASAAMNLAFAEYTRIAAFSRDPTFAEGNAAYAGQLTALQARMKALVENFEGFDREANRSRFNVQLLTAELDDNGRAVENLRQRIDALRQSYVTTGNEGFLAEAKSLQDQINAIENAGGGRSGRTRRAAMSEEEQARKRQTEATAQFIVALQDEIEKMGLSEGQLRQLEVARQRAAAQTEAERLKIEELNAAREEALTLEARRVAAEKAAGADKTMQERLEALQRELALLGLVGAQRELAALSMEQEAFTAKALADGVTDVNKAWEDYLRLRTAIVNGRSALEEEAEHARYLNDRLNDLVGTLGRLGGVGDAIAGVMQGIGTGSFAGLGSIGVIFDVLRKPDDYDAMGKKVADRIAEVFGVSGEFAPTMASVLQNAGLGVMAGSVVGGKSGASQVGGALGGILGGIGGEAFKGAITSVATGAFGTALGSAIGSAVPVIGTILGGIAGNLLGSLLTGVSKGSVIIGNVGGALGVTGTTGKSDVAAAAQQDAEAIIEALSRVASALGGSINAGAGRVSIGTRDGDYRVDPFGNGQTRLSDPGVMNFGNDAKAAVAAAMKDLIGDGVIGGLRASTTRLLQGGDLEAQLEKALAFEGVFKALQEATDPAGAALAQLEREMAGLRKIFDEAGASAEERAMLEQLEAKRRAEITKNTAASDETLTKRRELEIELMTLQGDFMGALAAARAQELAQLEPTLRALQEQVWAAQLVNERRDLEIALMRASGDEAGALAAQRAIELAQTHESLRALKQQVWAAEDAARATEELRKAWGDIGGTIEEEIRRIRGLNAAGGGTSFAGALGQFNAASAAARAGDVEAARSLPGLSQALLKLAEENARSRQELERVQRQTAASLEETLRALGGAVPSAQTTDALMAAIGLASPNGPGSANDNAMAGMRDDMRQSIDQLRRDTIAALAKIGGDTGALKKHLDNVTAATGGDAIATQAA